MIHPTSHNAATRPPRAQGRDAHPKDHDKTSVTVATVIVRGRVFLDVLGAFAARLTVHVHGTMRAPTGTSRARAQGVLNALSRALCAPESVG